jgi:hypothetical protein
VRAHVDAAVALGIADLLVGQAKGKPAALTVQPSDPTTLLTFNPATNTVGYTLDLRAVDVQVAGAAVCDDQCGSKEKPGTFSGHVGGLSGWLSAKVRPT